MRQLVSDLGAEVLVVDKLTYAGNLASLASVAQSPNFRFLRADICNPAAMAQAITDFRPDAIMHLAAESHVDRSIDGPATFIDRKSVVAGKRVSVRVDLGGRLNIKKKTTKK